MTLKTLPTFHIGNYRRLGGDQLLLIAPITIVVGNNSSGKSSILDAMRLWHRIASSGSIGVFDSNPHEGSSQRLFHMVANRGSVSNGISLGFTDDRGIGIQLSLAFSERLGIYPTRIKLIFCNLVCFEFNYEHLPQVLVEIQKGWSVSEDGYPEPKSGVQYASVDVLRGRAFVDNLRLLVEQARTSNAKSHFIDELLKSTTRDFDLQLDTIALQAELFGIVLNERNPVNIKFPPAAFLPENTAGVLVETNGLMALDPQIAFEDFESQFSYSGFEFICRAYREAMQASSHELDIVHLQPFRLRTSRYVDPSYQYSNDWIHGGGRHYHAMRTNKETLAKVNNWLARAGRPFSSCEYQVRRLVESGQKDFDNTLSGLAPFADSEESQVHYMEDRLTLVDISSGMAVGLDEVGTGISQVTPVLGMLFGETDSILQIEQPELHLHPKLQSRLADAMVDSIARGNSMIVETHSEHLILRLLHLVRNKQVIQSIERPLVPDDIQILFVEGEGSQSKVIPIDVTSTGSLSRPWPNGFFDESYDEQP